MKFICNTTKPKIVTNAFVNESGAEVFNAVKSARYIDYLDTLMFDLIIDMYNDNKTDESILSLTMSSKWHDIYNKLKGKLKTNTYYDAADDLVKADIDNIYNDWERFAIYHASYNNYIRVSDDFQYKYSEEGLSEELQVQVQDLELPEDEQVEDLDRKGNQFGEYELASPELRLLMRFVPRAKFNPEKWRGEYDVKEDKLPTKSDALNIMKLIIDKTKGIKNEDAFFGLLMSKEMLAIVPELDLLNKVLKFTDLGNQNFKQIRVLNHFYILFSRSYNPVYSSKKILNAEENVHQHFRNTRSNKEKILNGFKTAFQMRPYNTTKDVQYIEVDNSVDEDGNRNTSTDYGYGRKRLKAVPEYFPPKVYELEDLEEMSMADIKKIYRAHFNLFDLLGIKFSGLDSVVTAEEKLYFTQEVLNRASSMRDTLEERLQAGQHLFYPLEDVSHPYYYRKAKGERKTRLEINSYFGDRVADFEAKHSRTAATIMTKNAEGENQSDITLSNAFTIAFDALKNSSTEAEFLDNSYFYRMNETEPQYRNSFIRRTLFSGVDSNLRIQTENYNGYELVNEENGFKSSTKRLEDKDKFINDFSNMLIYGAVNTPQLERKSSYFSFRFTTKKGIGVTPIRDRTIIGDFTNNPIFFQQVLFYIHGEIMRVKNYPKSIADHKGLNEFSQFKFMEETLAPLVNLPNEQLSKLEDMRSPLSQSLKGEINKYFNSRLKEYRQFIDTNSISLRELIPDSLIADYVKQEEGDIKDLEAIRSNSLNDFLKGFIANTYIINTEFMIYVGGNPVFVKDYHKRLGGVASTGIQATIIPAINDLFNYDVEERMFFKNNSLRGILNSVNNEVVPRRDNSKNYQTAVIEEDLSFNNKYTEAKTLNNYIDSIKQKTGKTITKEQAYEDLIVESIEKKGIAVGDGEGYMNLDFHREMAIRQGVHRPNHDIAYKFEALVFKKDILKQALSEVQIHNYNKYLKLISDNPHQFALPILKESYYGPYANDLDVRGIGFDKFSLFPLLPTIVAMHGGPVMIDLLKTMAEKQIGYVKYKSGSKSFIRKVISMERLKNDNDLDLYHTDLLKLQIPPSVEEKRETTIPTQEVKLILANMFNNGQASEKVKSIRDEFINTLKDIQSINKQETLAGLGINDNGEWDLSVLVEHIRIQINNQQLPADFLDGLEIDQLTGAFKYPLEASGIYRQIIDYVLGFIDKKMRRFKVNGGDFVLVSPSMLKYKPAYYGYNKDKGTSACECYIALTKEYHKLLLLEDPKTGGEIGTIERLNELVKNRQFYEANEKALTISFSRPPVDAQHSMGFGRIIGFLFPTVGNAIILPEEYLHQAGIDFDYDKEKVKIPNLNYNGEYFASQEDLKAKLTALDSEYSEFREMWNLVGVYAEESKSYEEYDQMRNEFWGSDNFTKLIDKIFSPLEDESVKREELYKKAAMYMKLKEAEEKIAANKLLDIINRMLALPEQYSELILPSTTKKVKQLAKTNEQELMALNEDGSRKAPDFIPAILPKNDLIYDYLENTKVFKVFNDAAALLAPFALDNTMSQVLAQHHIEIPEEYAYMKGVPTRRINPLLLNEAQRNKIMKAGMFSLTNRENIEGEINQHLRSELISYTVDAAKDPSFADLNISFDNINTMIFLMYLGYPSEMITDFLNTTIIRKFIGLKRRGLKTVEAFEHIIRNEFKIDTKVSYTGLLGIDNGYFANSKINKVLTNKTYLFKQLKDYKVQDISSLSDPIHISDNIRLLANFVAMEDHASKLSDFKALFQNDTEKVMSLFDILSRREMREKVISKHMFTRVQIEAIENDSTISAYRNDDLIEEIITMISPVVSQEDVIAVLSSLYNARSKTDSRSSAILGGILSADFLTFNLLGFGLHIDIDGNEHKFYDYARALIIKIRDEETGKFSRVLLDRWVLLQNHVAYKDIINEFPVIELIQGAVSKRINNNFLYAGNYGYNLQLNVAADVPLITIESYKTQFRRLINGDFDFKDEEVNARLQNFIKDFFIAGLLQNGFNKTQASYVEYAPIPFIQSYLQPAINRFNNLTSTNKARALGEFSQLFLANNAKYYAKDMVEDGMVQESTYLGKYYATGNSLASLKKWDQPQEIKQIPIAQDGASPSEYENYSGGAKGSDSEWDTIGREFGVTNHTHFHAEGEKTPKGNFPLSAEQLREADPYVIKANETLQRKFPTDKEFVNNLLRRNYYQVKNSDAIFAISTITKNKVDGGTGWAVQMAIDMGKPVYVFDQNTGGWYTWNGSKFITIATPILTKKFAGIGTREITEQGKQAIRDVYEKTFNKNSSNTNTNTNTNNSNNTTFTQGDLFDQTSSNIITAYQGTKGKIDTREFNYFTTSRSEAKSYGNNIRSVNIDLSGFLRKGEMINGKIEYTSEYDAISTEFSKINGKRFDILDNSPEGLKLQEKFFNFVKSKGYTGYTEIIDGLEDQIDNNYIVTFNNSSITDITSYSEGTPTSNMDVFKHIKDCLGGA